MSKGTEFRKPLYGVRFIELRLYNCFRVGLTPHSTYLAGDVARRQALDLADGQSTGVDRVEHGPLIAIRTRGI